MARHVELAAHDAEDRTVRPDDEGGALARKRTEALDAEERGDLAVRIREQGETQVVLLVESLLPAHRVGADPYARRGEFRELGREVTKVTALDRSTRGHRFWIEEEDHGAGGEGFAQSEGVSVLVRGGKIGDPWPSFVSP